MIEICQQKEYDLTRTYVQCDCGHEQTISDNIIEGVTIVCEECGEEMLIVDTQNQLF